MSEVVIRRELVPSAPSTRLRRRWIGVLLGLALGTGGAGVIASGALRVPTTTKSSDTEKHPESAKDSVTMSKEKQTAAGIETTPVSAAPFRAHTWRTGRVALNDERVAHISPPVEGIVREVPARLGHTVAAGDVLAVIDCRELSSLKLELVKGRAALATEREAAARTRTTTANAAELLKLLADGTPLADIEKKLADKPIGDWRAQLLSAYTRRGQLRTQLASVRSSAGAVPESVALKIQSEADAANATYTGLVEDLRYQVKYQVRQAELKLREAETAVDVTRAKLVALGLAPGAVDALDPLAEGAKASLLMVRAPFAGTVVEKHVVLSERVGPQSQLFVLSDLSTVWIQADVFEADLMLLRGLTGRTVTFRSELAGVTERPATVVYTGDLIDKSSRALTLTAEAPNPERALKPGTMVEVGFDTGTSDPVVQVPASAVLRHENKPFVFVATNGDTFVKREVVLGRQSGDAIEITDGVRPGELVVGRGGFVLKSELLKDQMVGE
ncbi:efflux RND transporter periplasmic adaptor subunit [Gemmata sp. G18]|uniref:Efflux RND transporter periplasmic adaptor subunit n=1 Tax=Gemmata palustris TaxID=2822762 RepID=A0ABS5BTR6_9BACT|nr:efflux RND transporter periplasmic adaptor subunit [Gemmata palustris]MBP3957115.1 efflux RND transporter periplasmic adaptor subunit [Gemmata palustris]